MQKENNFLNQLKGFIFLSVFLFFFSSSIYAKESKECRLTPKKVNRMLKKANRVKNIKQKYRRIRGLIKQYPNHLPSLVRLAELNEYFYDQTLKPSEADNFSKRTQGYYKKIIEICPFYDKGKVMAKVAKFYFTKRMFSQAGKYYSKLANSLEIPSELKLVAKKKLNYITEYYKIKNNPLPFNPKRLKNISTPESEFLPVLSPDNRYIFFTRRTNSRSKKTFYGSSKKDIFFQSRKINNRDFSSGIPMPTPFNKGQFQGAASLTIDNKTLFITIVNIIPYPCVNKVDRSILVNESRNPSFENADIFYTEYINGQWTELKSIGDHINTKCTWESMPTVSADGKTLYFSRSMEPMKFDDLDIYKVEKQEDGSWGDPINLGPPINTPDGDEKSPFIHSDSQTLYFSSTGHTGMGGYDVFFSKKDLKMNKFTKPKNIGYPINNESDQHGFIIDRSGYNAYYSSTLKNSNQSDIYSFSLPKFAKPKRVVFIKGVIKDDKNNPLKGVRVSVKNITKKEELTGVYNNNTGEYVAVVNSNKKDNIILNYSKKGYVFDSKLIIDKGTTKGYKVAKSTLKKIKVGDNYRVSGIKFATNSYQLSKYSKLIIDQFYQFLLENKGLKIQINGHTDNVGLSSDNLKLSLNRAKAVKNYLVSKGIKSKGIKSKGFGDTKPVSTNATVLGRAKNRRTEFVIISD